MLAYDSAVSGRAVLAGFAPVAGHDWVVAVQQDRASAQAPLSFLQGGLLAGALGVTALMAAVAWLLARSVTRPIRRLTHAINDLKVGDFEDARVKAEGSDELGQLGRAFNALSDQMRQRERQRERQPDPAREQARDHPREGAPSRPGGLA